MTCKDKEIMINGKRYKLTAVEEPPRTIDWTKMPGDTLAEMKDYSRGLHQLLASNPPNH